MAATSCGICGKLGRMTSTESGIVVRTVRPEEWQSVQSLDALAFAFEAPPDYMEDLARPELEFDRFTGAYDPAEDRLIGTGAILSKQLTFPRRVRRRSLR